MNTDKQFAYKNIIRPLIAIMIIVITAVICLMIGPHKKQTTPVSPGNTQSSRSMEYKDASMKLAAEEEPAAVEAEEEPAAVEVEEEPAAVEAEEEPAAVEAEEEPAAVEAEEEPAAVEVEEEPAAVEVEEELAAMAAEEAQSTEASGKDEGNKDNRLAAFSEVIDEEIEEYGGLNCKPSEDFEEYYDLIGVSYLKLLDFDADGEDELLIVHQGEKDTDSLYDSGRCYPFEIIDYKDGKAYKAVTGKDVYFKEWDENSRFAMILKKDDLYYICSGSESPDDSTERRYIGFDGNAQIEHSYISDGGFFVDGKKVSYDGYEKELNQYQVVDEARLTRYTDENVWESDIVIFAMDDVIYRCSPKTSSESYDDLPAAEEVVDEPAAVEVEEEPAAVEVEEEPAAVEVEPAAEEVIIKAASEGATDVDIDSIVAPMGYDNLMGREYTTNAHFFYPSGEYEYYSWLDAEFAPFEKGVLGYAVDDFDCDGQNEILLVTVEDTPIIAEPYDPENVERDYDVKKYRHDVRMKVLEYDESRRTWKEASEKVIEMSDYGLYPVTGWFYKKYEDHVSIFYNRSGYLFDRGGHSSAVFCEYQYQDGTLEETEASHMLQGFAETTEGQMRFFFMFPDEAREAWDDYDFTMELDSFSSLTGFYVPDFDQSCVKIAEITASSKVSIADMQGETSDQIIPDAVTYNIINVR